MKSYLSVKQVVAGLNGAISTKLVYRLIAQGKLRVNRSLGKVLIEEESLIELLNGPTIPPPQPEEPPPPVRPRGRPKSRCHSQEAPLW